MALQILMICSGHNQFIGYSAPQHVFDWIYFSTSTGRKFLHHSDAVHKFSEGVIMQRREELLLKV